MGEDLVTVMAERHAATWSRHERDPWLLLHGGAPEHGNRSDDTWPRVAAFEHARHDLDRLISDSQSMGLPVPSPIARRRLQTVLRSVLANNSVYPTITYDHADEVLMAEW